MLLNNIDLLLQFLSLELEIYCRRLNPLQRIVISGKNLFHILCCLDTIFKLLVRSYLHRLEAH